jgi:hypothetical protein
VRAHSEVEHIIGLHLDFLAVCGVEFMSWLVLRRRRADSTGIRTASSIAPRARVVEKNSKRRRSRRGEQGRGDKSCFGVPIHKSDMPISRGVATISDMCLRMVLIVTG